MKKKHSAVILLALSVLVVVGCRKPESEPVPRHDSVPIQDTVPDVTIEDWVDLDLPSGLLWATRNVGADSAEDYGDYFAWGETSPKSEYNWSTYRYCNYNSTTGSVMFTMYTGNNGLNTLLPGDDAATANYGGRTPTAEEWHELITNTTSRWTIQNGVKGRRFTAANGNSIFLPAAGYRWDDGVFDTVTDGYYWSSTLFSETPFNACVLAFTSGEQDEASTYRANGHSVRAVRFAQ